jgi:hypothetical protein
VTHDRDLPDLLSPPAVFQRAFQRLADLFTMELRSQRTQFNGSSQEGREEGNSSPVKTPVLAPMDR